MLTMSKALSAGQAKDYYQAEYTGAEESYYSEGETVQGQWAGELAAEWGLEGAVEQEAFERLCDGQDPLTGEQLVRHVTQKEYTNKYGDEVKPVEHRAGWDATFSAPKSVSLAALIGGDERIKEAHGKAVDAALKVIEEDAHAHRGGDRAPERTGKFVAAKFEHDAARPDKETGYAAPQLHTHAVIFNLTKTHDRRVRAMQERELFRAQGLGTAVYRSELAMNLRALGYEIEVDQRTGAPEIKGISHDYREANSPRSEEIKREAAEIKERLEREGATVKEGAGLMQAAAKMDRASKDYDRDEMRVRHMQMEESYGNQARSTVQAARERGPLLTPDEEIAQRARAAVTFARENAVEREAVVDRREVVKDALRRNLGLTTHEAVMRELESREARGEFVGIIREKGGTQQTTTNKTLRMEERNIRTILDGQATQSPLLEMGKAAEVIAAIAEKKGIRLNEGQERAVTEILTNRDRILGLQGGAGTGKTTTLAVLRAGAMQAGYEVEGFAPTTRAAALLAESGMPTKTLQKFIAGSNRQESAADSERKVLYVLDETSLASTKNIHM